MTLKSKLYTIQAAYSQDLQEKRTQKTKGEVILCFRIQGNKGCPNSAASYLHSLVRQLSVVPVGPLRGKTFDV